MVARGPELPPVEGDQRDRQVRDHDERDVASEPVLGIDDRADENRRHHDGRDGERAHGGNVAAASRVRGSIITRIRARLSAYVRYGFTQWAGGRDPVVAARSWRGAGSGRSERARKALSAG